ncbi:MAG TPA: type IV secretory system conjugative DNA transfer family protein [Gemmatimonadaceae bacterium]|nr:type IV secretory system conjugative DNA transfer family protein [Gemmatimonadaceae bacterium]
MTIALIALIVTDRRGPEWDNGRSLRRRAGLIVGRTRWRFLRYAGEGHILTVAPTRSGKGVGAVIPNLLLYPGSIVVTDPKGENYAVTAARRRALGHRVLAYDPFGVIAAPADRASYNPLDHVRGLDDARLLADMLIIPDGRNEPFWEEEARALLTGLILYAMTQPAPSLLLVRSYLTSSAKDLRALLGKMAAHANPLVGRMAAQISQKSPRERSAVLSTAQSHTHFLDSAAMATVLRETRIPDGGAETTTYLILPPERMDGYRRWLRLMIGSMLNMITRQRRSRRVIFLLDEFAHLGRMRPVEQGISLVGGYGVGFWLLVQDLAQLRAIYGESAATFLANAEVLQAFGINDYETAEHLSRLSGRLITADEVRRLAPEFQLLFVRGHGPIAARRVSYLSDRAFRGLAEQNPLAVD